MNGQVAKTQGVQFGGWPQRLGDLSVYQNLVSHACIRNVTSVHAPVGPNPRAHAQHCRQRCLYHASTPHRCDCANARIHELITDTYSSR